MNSKARAWIAALRSGKYAQGELVLRHKDKFCCLGVACDVYDRGQWQNIGGLSGCIVFMKAISHLPTEVAEAMHFNAQTVYVDWDDIQHKLPDVAKKLESSSSRTFFPSTAGLDLTRLNDAHGLTFAEIADVLETYEDKFFHER